MDERTMWVLVIDDVVANTIFISTALKSMGHHPVVSHDATEALMLIDQMAFDYILVDFHMPNIDGATFLSALHDKLAAFDRTIPVCVVTADTSTALDTEAQRLGATAVLHKPLSTAVLGAVLSKSATILPHRKKRADHTTE